MKEGLILLLFAGMLYDLNASIVYRRRGEAIIASVCDTIKAADTNEVLTSSTSTGSLIWITWTSFGVTTTSACDYSSYALSDLSVTGDPSTAPSTVDAGNGHGLAAHWSGHQVRDWGKTPVNPTNWTAGYWARLLATPTNYYTVMAVDEFSPSGHNHGVVWDFTGPGVTNWLAGAPRCYLADGGTAHQLFNDGFHPRDDGRWHSYLWRFRTTQGVLRVDDVDVYTDSVPYTVIFDTNAHITAGAYIDNFSNTNYINYANDLDTDNLKIWPDQWMEDSNCTAWYNATLHTNPPPVVGATDLVLAVNWEQATNFLGGTNWNVVDTGYGRTVTVTSVQRPLQLPSDDGMTNMTYFNGSANAVNFGYAKNYTSATKVIRFKSTSMAINVDPLSRYNFVGGQEDGDYLTGVAGGIMKARFLNGSGQALFLTSGTNVFNDGPYHTWATVMSVDPVNSANNYYELYRDGILLDRSNVNFVVNYPTGTAEVVGSNFETTDGYFGNIQMTCSWARIYNRALSSNEVAGLP